MSLINGTPEAEVLQGTDADDVINGLGGDDTLFGSKGDDTLDGGEGDDSLYGEEGDDILNGGEGNDKMFGGAGRNKLIGGAGNDVFETIGSGTRSIVYAGDGDDVINPFNGGTITPRMGALDAFGEAGDDKINGTFGNDTLDGGIGNDNLEGYSGDDILVGGDGDDFLAGGPGDDILIGGDGNDVLVGGYGNNEYYYSSGSDRFLGFSGEDSIYFNTVSGDLKNIRFEDGLVFTINGADIVTNGIDNFIFIDKKYTIWDLIEAVQETTYIESYYLKSIEEKKEILENFSQLNFIPSNFLLNTLENSISIFYPKEPVRDRGSWHSGDYIFTPISDEEKIVFKKSLDYLSSYINLIFAESGTYENSNLVVEKHEMSVSGYASRPGENEPAYLAMSTDLNISSSLFIGVFVHELGHVLNLDHPNDYIILSDDNGDFLDWEIPENLKIPLHLDAQVFSTMSYRYTPFGIDAGVSGYTFGPLDIAYLEQYGTTVGKDTVYILKINDRPSGGLPDVVVSDSMTIIEVETKSGGASREQFLLMDSGGSDQFNASDMDINTTLVFDLYRGYIGTRLIAFNGKYALKNPMIEIYPSTIIEKYIGHNGKDHFILGNLEVQIDSLDGDDQFYVYGLASSLINGGEGNDSIYFDEPKENYVVSQSGDVSYIVSDKHTYSLTSIENVYFNANYYSRTKLFANAKSYDEGQIASFSLDTDLAPGTPMSYTLSGVSAPDLESGSLTGTAVVSASGITIIDIPLAEDSSIEGEETLTITLDDSPDKIASLIIDDSEVYAVSIGSSADSYDEGGVVRFELLTTNLEAGSQISYTLAGVPDWHNLPSISEADLIGRLLTGTAIIDVSGKTIIDIPLAADAQTEGAESLSITLDEFTHITTSVIVNDLSKDPSITLIASNISIGADEGNSAHFVVVVDNIAMGTKFAYTLSGVSASDLNGGSLTGTVTVDNKFTFIEIPLLADALTEGEEILTITLDDFTEKKASLTINDTSKNSDTVTTTHLTSILVDEDVLGASPLILQGLTENIEKTDGVTTSHVFTYSGMDYDYDDISPFIMVVVRDNEFTDDFRSELADFAPEYKNLTYQEAVDAVGLVGISAAIITVAGADGNYIG
ncbi:hypothetical protein OAE55_05210 [Gammaproteobacteria bacterium]|nr:hypothetical protein [Gammaproteobacteria bacterium]